MNTLATSAHCARESLALYVVSSSSNSSLAEPPRLFFLGLKKLLVRRRERCTTCLSSVVGPRCGEKTDSVQSYTYANSPEVLAFAINRFQIDFRRGRRVKLTSKYAPVVA